MTQRVCVFLSLLLLANAGPAEAQQNLVKNPGFEEPPSTNGKPSGGWWLYQGKGNPELKLDTAVAHQGQASVSVQATEETKCTVVSAPFTVAPEDELRFEGWVRGQGLPASRPTTCAGIAFRRADGAVFGRASFQTEPLGSTWSRVSGTAVAPPGAVSAEVHLGYTNAPGTIWFDDVSAIITNPLSLALVEGAKPWPGEQELTLRVTSRQSSPFQGSIRATSAKQVHTVPVSLEPGSTRQFQVPLTLQGVGTHEYALSLLDAAGRPLRALHGKFRISPALALYPACPCYQPVGSGDIDTRIDAHINLNPAERHGLRLQVDLADSNGKLLQTVRADASQGDIVGGTLRIPTSVPAVFTVTARLADASGRELVSASTDIHVAPPDQSQVLTGPDGFLRVARKAEFVLGLYSSGHFEEMGQAGFNATHNYEITTGEASLAINPNEAEVKRLLDQSWANGMRMMVELPRKAIEKAQWQQVRGRIETFRYHPGLLCWGSEERVARGTAPLSHIAQLYQLVHELDPNHPLVLGDTRAPVQTLRDDRSDFFPDASMDAGIWWWYPIPLHAPDANGLDGRDKPSGLLQPPSWLTTTHSKKPLWIAIQSYQQPRRDARFPTPAEYRCMAYLSIINGVKGLWFYTGSGQKDWQGKPAGILNKPEEGHWDYVKKLVAELRDFSPVIMAPSCTEKVALSPADAPVEFATRQLDGRLYLLAANKSGQTQSVQFTSPAFGGKRVEVLYENHTASLTGDSFKDELTAFGVHLYRLE